MLQSSKKIGFLLLTCSEPDKQFKRLLEKLKQFDESSIVIHHDSFQGGKFPTDIISNYSIQLVEPSYRTYWSHLNNVLATIDGFKVLYDNSPEIDWFVTLTPSCYPIKPISEIQKFYDSCQFDALIDMHQIGKSAFFAELDKFLIRDFKEQPWIKIPFLSRKGKFQWKQIRKSLRLNQHPFLDINVPYQGSNWFSINRKIVKELLDRDIKNGELIQFYKNNIVSQPDMHPCPQETILPTFIGNIPSINICFDNYRFIDWHGAKNWSPNNLTMEHYNFLTASSAHWARKFDTQSSSGLADRIDSQLLK